ncbi:thioesterase II family protein [Streptomyces orinoci]|uniref:Alpha/beta fold hydrolase n=1 Tax=Streptomyces orinoci TaxID=67339 RepID=A0ABV3K3A2_STRON|nr:alpha/beta fold hydrolase [Streptomyces orinoci]
MCLPHAGGSAAYFFPLSRALASVASVAAVQYPGRQERYAEPLVKDLHRLADEIADAVRPLLDRPTAFFGHSMGALLAFEVVRRLERDPAFTARHLFLSGHGAPSRHYSEGIHLRDDKGVIAAVRALGGSDAAVLDNPELLRMALPVLRADFCAVENYRCEPGASVRSPVTVLTGDADPRTSFDDACAWREHTTGNCDVRVFPGGHFYLNDQREKVVKLLLTDLEAAIEQT